MSFYLTLPSNSSLSYHPENTITHYLTQLPKSIELKGEWEVGLAEVQYPQTWYNIPEATFAILVQRDLLGAFGQNVKLMNCPSGFKTACEISERTGLAKPRLMTIRPGFYTPRSLVEELNAQVREKDSDHLVQFKLDKIQKKVTVVIESQETQFIMNEIISELLGFETVDLTSTSTGTRVVDINRSFCGLYIYCSVIEPQVVGDTITPLLRIVPVNYEGLGRVVTRTYEKIFYYPVATKNFSSVEILIRDDTGVPVPFEFGKVTVTLHFRKTKKHLF